MKNLTFTFLFASFVHSSMGCSGLKLDTMEQWKK